VSGVVHAGHVDAAAGLLGVPELRAPGSGDQAAVALGAGSPDLDDAARRAVDHACSRRKPSLETTGGRLHPRGAVHGVPGSGGCPGPGGAERLGPRGPRGVSLGVARRRRVPRLDPCWRSSPSVCCCGWCSAGAGRHAARGVGACEPCGGRATATAHRGAQRSGCPRADRPDLRSHGGRRARLRRRPRAHERRAVVGLAFGPPGFAAGLVAGGEPRGFGPFSCLEPARDRDCQVI
jgi:hypothetical protein